MHYLLKRSGRYYYNRRVPKELKEFDPRPLIRIALKTDSRKEAMRLACFHNEELEGYWKRLIHTGQRHELTAYENLVHTARLAGFSYMPSDQLAQSPLDQIYARLLQYEKVRENEHQVAAILGAAQAPKLKVADAIERYFDYAKSKILNKSANQVRKWKNPRKLAMATFTKSTANKDFCLLTRDDILKYRDWWINRVEFEEVTATTANKNIILVKTIVETVNDNLNLGLDARHLFRKIILPKDEERQRPPFSTEHILSVLLNPYNLKGLNEQAFWALHAVAETGAGISEQAGLLPEDIVLDCDIPHIVIMPRQKKELKTRYRKRIIPLVGYALDAFRACPNGFTAYRDKPDTLSTTLNKYLKENGLLPSDDYSVYSLRHSFQDRLLAVNIPDRVQADLMGHKFNRPAYGNGASLEQKYDWMKKVQLKNQ